MSQSDATRPEDHLRLRSGGLAARVFAERLQRVGFGEVWWAAIVLSASTMRRLFPLFTDEVIVLMKRTIAPEHHDHVATSVIIKALKADLRQAEARRVGQDGGPSPATRRQ